MAYWEDLVLGRAWRPASSPVAAGLSSGRRAADRRPPACPEIDCLHAHLPWVLHHGRWPHGVDWLNEAAAETYLLMTRTAGWDLDTYQDWLTTTWTRLSTPPGHPARDHH